MILPTHQKRELNNVKNESLYKDAINQGKAYLLGGKKPWTFEYVDSLSDEAVNKFYCEYKQREIQ